MVCSNRGVDLRVLTELQYVDKAVVLQAGYQSHKDMKKAMFSRAKVRTQIIPILPRSTQLIKRVRISVYMTMDARRIASS